MTQTRNLNQTTSDQDLSFTTSTDLTALQYCFVKYNGGDPETPGVGGKVEGVLQNGPNLTNTGTTAIVRVGDRSLLVLGVGGCNAGDYLKSDANGNGVVCSNGDEFHAYALSGGVEGDEIIVQIIHGTAKV